MENPQEFAWRTGIHRIQLPTPFIVGPVNLYLWTGSPLTLFDTGVKDAASLDALEAGLRNLGYALSDIERVMLTHHHIDHCGLLQTIVKASGAEAWMHPDAPEQSRSTDGDDNDDERRQTYLDMMAEFGVPPDIREQSMQNWGQHRHLLDHPVCTHPIHDGARIGPFSAYYVPGHSATDILFLHEEHGYSIAGDHILAAFNPNPLLRRPSPGKPREKALVEYQRSLHRSRTLPLGLCLPGHGDPIPNPIEIIDGIFESHAKRNEKILANLPPEGITPYDTLRLLYPRIPAKNLYLGLSVAVGQLEVLEHEGRLRSARHNGLLRYWTNAHA